MPNACAGGVHDSSGWFTGYHDLANPSTKNKRTEAADPAIRARAELSSPAASHQRLALQDGDLSTPLNAPPPVQLVPTPPLHPHTRRLGLEPHLSVAWFLCTFELPPLTTAPVDSVCPNCSEYSGPRRAMIIPAGIPEPNLLRVLFLGLSTLGESNLGPGGSLIR